MRVPSGFLKWAAGLLQDFGVGFVILGIGSLVFNQAANEGSPLLWGVVFIVFGWTIGLISGLIEIWLVVRANGN